MRTTRSPSTTILGFSLEGNLEQKDRNNIAVTLYTLPRELYALGQAAYLPLSLTAVADPIPPPLTAGNAVNGTS